MCAMPPSRPRRPPSLPWLTLAAVLAASLAAGCADNTALRLVIRSNLAVPSEMDGLRIEMRSSTGASAPARIVPLRDSTFPQTLVVRPEPNGGRGTVTFTVQGLHAGTIVIQRVIPAMFQAGQVLDVEVALDSDCLGVECGPGIDCLRGVCHVVEPSDAGIPDASGGDAGPVVVVDAGAPDALVSSDAFSPMDAEPSSDAFSPTDGSTPSDAPAPLDAFMSIDAAPTPDAFREPDAFTLPDSGVGCAGASCAGAVLISEFTYQGPSSGLDEFVEIYNASDRSADIGGMRLFYTAASGSSRSGKATIPPGTLLPPHGYYLLVGSGYSTASVPGDASTTVPWTDGASDRGGGFSLENGAGVVIDRVCWGTAVASICRGTGLPATQPPSGSFERRARASSTAESMSPGGADEHAGNGYDTGDNLADFVVRSLRDPQNSSSPPEP